MKKFFALTLAACTLCPAFATVASEDNEYQGFVLQHTHDLQGVEGYDDIYLDEMPQKIVALSTYPVRTIYEMGANLIAVPVTTTMTYPEDLDAIVVPSVNSSNYDVELIVAMEPDLVIIAATAMSVHGQTLKDAGIPVYGIGMSDTTGQMNVYEYMKHQTEVLTQAFAVTDEAKIKADEIMDTFAQLEERIDEVKPLFEDKTYVALSVASATDYYLQGPNGTIGTMLSMLGWTDVFATDDEAEYIAHGMTGILNLEEIVGIDMDKIFFLTSGAATLEEAAQMAQDAKDSNPLVWNEVVPVKQGNEVALTSSYIVSAGIQIVDSINSLIDILVEDIVLEDILSQDILLQD
ncbi:MAG: hypothetical protein BEN18_02055 [Epulopiscium sp. Nuni2H_MBin001]|nr:MAG: hypothetical protein BEN18_02055 [Epulopiscium sp. Nuni2H_MBin001]